MFNGRVEYQTYEEIEKRIKNFDNNYTLGKDASGDYDIYMIEMGDSNNPTIFITASIHGNEWQSAHHIMNTLELLRDGEYPDKTLENTLKNHFHLAVIPVVNPWGYDRGDTAAVSSSSRENSNGVDINRDFINQSQPETNIVMEQFNRFTPFSYIDNHLFQSAYTLANGNDFIVYTERSKLHYIRDNIKNDLENYSGRKVTTWDSVNNKDRMAVGYGRLQDNPHTPETLSILTEIERPTQRDGGYIEHLDSSEMYQYGLYFHYSYLNQVVDYYIKHNQIEVIPEITDIPDDLEVGTFISRNDDGLTETMIQRRDKRETSKIFVRNNSGYVTRVETETKDI